MTHFRQFFMTLAFAVCLSSAVSAATINDVVRIADTARGGGLPGVVWSVTVDTRSADGDTDMRQLDVAAIETDWSAEYIAPGNIRGQRLIKRGTNMWFSKPGLRKPVPISLRERIVGGAANGDIASTNYLRDYNITRLPDQTIQGIDSYVLQLDARSSNVAYDRIKYWIDKSSNLGVAANFYTRNGRLLKSATFRYDNRIRVNGQARPFVSRMIIRDAINQGDVTTLNYANPDVRSVPQSQLQP